MDNTVINVSIPNGKLQAKQMPDNNYPGICVSFIGEDGKEAASAIMEYSPDEKSIKLRAYGQEHPDGEPVINRVL